MNDIINNIKRFKGKKSFICMELDLTLHELDILCESNADVAEAFVNIENEQAVLNSDLFDVQLQMGLLLGDAWALAHIAKQKNLSALPDMIESVGNSGTWDIQITNVGKEA